MRRKRAYEVSNGINGSTLDGIEMDCIPYDMLDDIKGISCYTYEDGKTGHDHTCVMEFSFWNPHEELDGDCRRLRILYLSPWDLLKDLGLLIGEHIVHFKSLNVDLTPNLYDKDNIEYDVDLKDFDRYECCIEHKKHFYPSNIEMPDD